MRKRHILRPDTFSSFLSDDQPIQGRKKPRTQKNKVPVEDELHLDTLPEKQTQSQAPSENIRGRSTPVKKPEAKRNQPTMGYRHDVYWKLFLEAESHSRDISQDQLINEILAERYKGQRLKPSPKQTRGESKWFNLWKDQGSIVPLED